MQAGQIFFSYSRVDGKFALKLAEDLRKAGVDIWIDQIDIRPSEPWDEEIEKALLASGCLLVILSDTSVASDNVLNEINYAIESKKQVLPILLEKNIKKPINIGRLQHIDFTGSYQTGLNTLLRSLSLKDQVTVPKKSIFPRVIRIILIAAIIVAVALFIRNKLFEPGSDSSSLFKKSDNKIVFPGDNNVININGRWTTPELVNPFDDHDKYKIHFDLEAHGDKLLGSVIMQSTVDYKGYNFKREFLEGAIKDSTIYFYTVEQMIDGRETANYKNFYFGVVSKDAIKFSLESDRPTGFPGQKFIAQRGLP